MAPSTALKLRDQTPVAIETPALTALPALGSLARHIFRTHRLYDRPRHPRVKLLHWPVLRQLALIAHGLYCWVVLGGTVERRFDRSRLQQLRDIVVLGVTERLDAQTYYMQELYLKGGARRGAETLTRFESKNGLFTALKRLRPRGIPHRSPLGDKLAFFRHCRRHDLPAVPIVMSAKAGIIDPVAVLLPTGTDLFLKPRHGKGARGAAMLRALGDDHYRDDTGRILTRDEVRRLLIEHSLETPYLLQPRLQNHPGIADLAGQSLLVVRVITCLDQQGQPIVTHAMLRVLGKLEPDWNDTTEYAAPIDLVTGRLGVLTGDKLQDALIWHRRHPVTGALVAGRRLPLWAEVHMLALQAHRAFTDRLLLGWDIAITPDGVMLIEGNALPDVAFLQRVHRQPLGASALGPLLHHYFDRLQRVAR